LPLHEPETLSPRSICSNTVHFQTTLQISKCLPARRYTSAGNSDRNVSVRLSVCPSVTRWYYVKTKKASIMISSLPGSRKTLVF